MKYISICFNSKFSGAEAWNFCPLNLAHVTESVTTLYFMAATLEMQTIGINPEMRMLSAQLSGGMKTSRPCQSSPCSWNPKLSCLMNSTRAWPGDDQGKWRVVCSNPKTTWIYAEKVIVSHDIPQIYPCRSDHSTIVVGLDVFTDASQIPFSTKPNIREFCPLMRGSRPLKGERQWPIHAWGNVWFSSDHRLSGARLGLRCNSAKCQGWLANLYAQRQFNNISGIKSGADVQISGVTVGKVRQLRLNKENQAVVSMQLDRRGHTGGFSWLCQPGHYRRQHIQRLGGETVYKAGEAVVDTESAKDSGTLFQNSP